MKQFLCPKCQAPIVCTIKRQELYYYQDENDNIVRDTNQDYDSNVTYFHFQCSNNSEDNLGSLEDTDDFFNWKQEYELTILNDIRKNPIC